MSSPGSCPLGFPKSKIRNFGNLDYFMLLSGDKAHRDADLLLKRASGILSQDRNGHYVLNCPKTSVETLKVHLSETLLLCVSNYRRLPVNVDERLKPKRDVQWSQSREAASVCFLPPSHGLSH